MKNFKLFVVIILSASITACERFGINKKTKPDAENAERIAKPKGFNNQVVPYDLLALEDESFEYAEHEPRDGNIEENLHGKFYDEQASFYIVKEPENTIFKSEVSKITLYYLKDKLYQSKYELKKDITNQLINTYGNFKIQGFDEENREAIETIKIVVRNGRNWVLNPNLNNYELTWQLAERELKIRVNKSQEMSSIFYVESHLEYKKLYKVIAKSKET